ncbi:ArsC/Spx/MgsR family protein [Lactococcus garvieae]|uniref:ArsC/Spx/MgsR family protein n=2 Tax=Lactococcus TaxID=1357 RepID=UPI0025507649|nr:ArsC/Spx/MgsR family protein [Lactococcus garvieae]
MLKKYKNNKIIRIYSHGRNTSDKQAVAWFKSRGFEICEKKMYHLSKENLLQILALTEQGFTEILKHRAGEGTALRNKLDAIQALGFNDSVAYIVKNPDVLKSPIIFGDHKLLVGFNAEEIRKFIPKRYRKVAVKASEQSRKSDKKGKEV